MNPRISKWFHEFLSGVFTKSTASPSRVSCLRFVRESHLNDLKPSREITRISYYNGGFY